MEGIRRLAGVRLPVEAAWGFVHGVRILLEKIFRMVNITDKNIMEHYDYTVILRVMPAHAPPILDWSQID